MDSSPDVDTGGTDTDAPLWWDAIEPWPHVAFRVEGPRANGSYLLDRTDRLYCRYRATTDEDGLTALEFGVTPFEILQSLSMAVCRVESDASPPAVDSMTLERGCISDPEANWTASYSPPDRPYTVFTRPSTPEEVSACRLDYRYLDGVLVARFECPFFRDGRAPRVNPDLLLGIFEGELWCEVEDVS